MEDAEQHEGIPREMTLEPRFVETQPDRGRAQHSLAELRHRVDVLQHRGAQICGAGREQVRAVQRTLVRGQLLPEVQPFLLVGRARGQLASYGEPAAPRPATPAHVDRSLFVLRQGEELACQRVEAL